MSIQLRYSGDIAMIELPRPSLSEVTYQCTDSASLKMTLASLKVAEKRRIQCYTSVKAIALLNPVAERLLG
jgi:hypothetical protein